MSKTKLDEEFVKLEKLICWHEHYKSADNPIEANKVQKEIEKQKKLIKELKNGQA